MTADLWRRIWHSIDARGPSAAQRSRGERDIVGAAARGEPVEALLELAAQSLLAASQAERVGLWLLKEYDNESGHSEVRGWVVDSSGVPPPQEWNRLDLPASFLGALLQSKEPLIVATCDRARNASPSFPPAGPCAEAKRVIWIPLRVQGTPLGIGMIADSRARPRGDDSALRAIADELSVALALHHERARRIATDRELAERSRLERSIQRGIATDVILAEIAPAVERAAGAEFVAIGRRGPPPGESLDWVGTPEWQGLLTQEPLLQLWVTALEEARTVEAEAESLRWRRRGGESHAGTAAKPEGNLARIVTMPLIADAAPLGVLMAGLGTSAQGDEITRRLESYAALAAMALQRELSLKQNSLLAAAFRHWLETTPEQLLVVDSSGHIEQSSRAARGTLSLGPPLAAQVRLRDLFAEGAGQAIEAWLRAVAGTRPDRLSAANSSDRAFAALPLDALLSNGAPMRLSLRSQMPSARPPVRSWLVALESLSPPPAALDVVEERRAALELSGLLDSLDSGVLVFDASGRMRAANDRFAQMMSLDTRLLRELGAFERLVELLSPRFAHPAEFAARWRERLERTDEASWDELELLRPERKIVERFARPVRDARGARLGWIEVYRDITSQRLIQSKLMQTEKMAALGQLVSGIAHELNNPLTSIQGYAQLLLTRRPGPERQADAQRICQEAERAGRIVKNLLLFARDAKPERRSVDLNEVVERTLALRSYEMKLENIQAELELDPRLPPILADASQMLQVVLNLVVNAEQALDQARDKTRDQPREPGPDDGREPKRERGRIRIRTRRVSEQRLALEVSDDGPGIPPEAISRIFDPFFTTKPPGVGTGLGLSIVYGIVREHGGEISVESRDGRGATFVVELAVRAATDVPLSGVLSGNLSSAPAAESTPSGLAVASAGRAHKPALHGERILVVEDEPTVAQLIADVLADAGHRADKLLDSREALERVRLYAYDLVICDLKMPHLDGRAFYRALVNAGNPLQHRLVFVTGDTLSPHTLEFLESSGLPYLAKPFLVEELKQAVQQAFARVRAALPRTAGETNSWPQANARKQIR